MFSISRKAWALIPLQPAHYRPIYISTARHPPRYKEYMMHAVYTPPTQCYVSEQNNRYMGKVMNAWHALLRQ